MEEKRASDVAEAADSWHTHGIRAGCSWAPIQPGVSGLWESLRLPIYEWGWEGQLSRREEEERTKNESSKSGLSKEKQPLKSWQISCL